MINKWWGDLIPCLVCSYPCFLFSVQLLGSYVYIYETIRAFHVNSLFFCVKWVLGEMDS